MNIGILSIHFRSHELNNSKLSFFPNYSFIYQIFIAINATFNPLDRGYRKYHLGYNIYNFTLHNYSQANGISKNMLQNSYGFLMRFDIFPDCKNFLFLYSECITVN